MGDIFLAIFPDAEAGPRIAGLSSQLGLQGTAVLPHRLHVSLHWVKDHAAPAAVVDAAKSAAAAVDMPCFRIAFDRVQSFNGETKVPVVLAGGDELVGLLMLREMLVARLGHRAKPGFTPHLTFLYRDRHTPEIAIAPVSWIVREMALVQSLSGKHEYELLARFPLRKGAIG
jgi:2'-5' RNA ligase